ncbi:hypothetical protein PALB_29140 [Pseudoalteromonas luteoviolacea B = ATCC 29581]|nr:hypothetical protein PALB_29140 [Pseudoalteromonas luteoviolacea B = ATCC 29581]
MLNLITLSQLKTDVGHDLHKTLLTLFIDETDNSINQLSAKDITTTKRISHSLKSSAASYGADGLAAVSKSLEQACKEEQLEAIPSLIENSVALWQALKIEYDRYLDSVT